MGKRTVFEDGSKSVHVERDTKRQRVDNNAFERNSPRPTNGTADEVTTARSLQKALLFDQGATADFRNGEDSRSLASAPWLNILRPEPVQTIPRLHLVLC